MELFQRVFPKCFHAHYRFAAESVVFFVVCGVVFRGGDGLQVFWSIALQTANKCSTHCPAEIRVFSIGFTGSRPARIAADVDYTGNFLKQGIVKSRSERNCLWKHGEMSGTYSIHIPADYARRMELLWLQRIRCRTIDLFSADCYNRIIRYWHEHLRTLSKGADL